MANASLTTLSAAQRAQMQARLDAFRQSWNDQALAGSVKQAPPAADPLRLPLLIGLVMIDLEQQWRHGRRPTVEGFLHFCPELGTRDSAPVELIHVEYLARQQHGGGANLADFRRRFPNQVSALQALLAPAKSVASPPPPPPKSSSVVIAPSSVEGVSATVRLDRLPAPFGNYQLLEQVGRGGMGVVYRAEEQGTKKRVAIKVMHEVAEGAADLLQRFLREGQLAATLKHPNLNQVLEVGEMNGRHYLVMRFLDGQTLAEVLKRGPMEQRKAVEMVRVVANALQAAHVQGIIHRDLKPANIMIDGKGQPMVMDFGLARRNSDIRATVNGQMLGTPTYMPPEQVMGDVEGMGPACDVYSLGVILYECVTGRPPFQGDIGTVMLSVMKKPPMPPTQVRKGIDPRIDSLCLRALAKDPDNRFATMSDFESALTNFLDGRAVPPPVIETSPSKVGPILDARRRPPPRRQSKRWAIFAGIAAGLLVAGLLGWFVVNSFTPRGVIRIEVDDPHAIVLIDDDEMPLKKGKTEMLTLTAGTHRLVVRVGDREEEQELVVRKGRNKTFKAALPPREPPPPVIEEKWAPIFNGKDLAGWHLLGGEPIMFRATNEGVLSAFGPGPGWLLTDKSYGDFELRLEYRLTHRSSSGVALRAPSSGAPTTDGIEIQLIDHSHFPTQAPLDQHGALRGVAEPAKIVGLGVGSWHKLHVTCRRAKLTATIDGTTILDIDLDSQRAFHRTNPGLQRRKGHIGLEAQDGVVSFRAIEVKELHDASRTAMR